MADSTTVCLMLSDNTICFSGDFPAQSVAIPVLSDGEYFVKICAGDHHYTALSNKGRIYSWGGNILGQCDISEIKGTASDVFAGANQSYVIDGEGSLLAKWGHRGYIFGTDPNGASVFQRIANGIITGCILFGNRHRVSPTTIAISCGSMTSKKR